ncbi:MAG: 3-deoxy-D-manno-octulosonic acid transferase, partial [Verrucomicrobiae bacterium]|nr:3-deoxy-D-manno-octulosonic acid transferase [Verrucomicrobiae bacterium]
MNRFFVYLIYNLLLPVVLILGFPRFVTKGLQRGGLARNFRQRLGLYRPETRERLGSPGNLWIHAVSVGEVLVALYLNDALRHARSDAGIVLSTTTTTGFAL